MLVVDLAHDLLDDILDRHQPVGAAILVDDEREVNARSLHLRQQIDRPHRRRNIKQLADDVGLEQRQGQVDVAQIEPGRRRLLAPRLGDVRLACACRHERQEIADVHDPFRIVEGLVVDDEARMRRAFEQAHQLADLDIALDRDDVGAMHHDVGDAPFVQVENIAQHGALDRGKSDIVGRRGIEHDLQVVAHRSGLPAEQAADDPQQPAFRRGPTGLALRHHGRQVARIARIVVGRFGIGHVSQSVPAPHKDRESRDVPGSPARALPLPRRRRRSRDRSRSDGENRGPQDG